MRSFDYIIVGSGIAGLYAGLLASEAGSVLLITKGSLDECNTKFAQGGIAAAIGPDDSPDLHRQDTEDAGAELNDPESTRILAEDGPDRVADLIRFGVPFDTVHGAIDLAREGAHSRARVLHAGGDATGKHIELVLADYARRSKMILSEHSLLADVKVDGGAVSSVKVFDSRTAMLDEVRCTNLILATGGAGRLFKLTTNSEVVTGDGVALAFRAGAEVMDMEFFQFHPTALRLSGVPVFLISEAVRGEGGILRSRDGRSFMVQYSEHGDLAPRDVVARSIVTEMKQSKEDHVYLDVRHLPASQVSTRFPQIYQFCLNNGLDVTQNLIPVAPAAHYMMGGVKVNSLGETNVKGLLATGETSCTGAHGANRLASNSLLETLVFGKRLVDGTLGLTKALPHGETGRRAEEVCSLPPRNVDQRDYQAPSMSLLQNLMWDCIGIERVGSELENAATTLAAWDKAIAAPSDRSTYDLRNAITVGRLIAEASLYRQESRGAHFRSDFPESSPKWLKHVVWVRRGGAIE
ncbi:L-aspartate oxidase [Dehalococcoidia bacterium]|nr:L-aspartate oxidase [Dehalococcoidia bacterium]MCL0101622.1 L-aspartate oxidase [Dehalococcoidia bacterium]